MRKLNKERIYTVFITIVAIVSLFGNYFQNISIEKACVDNKQINSMQNELREAKKVEVYGDKMTVKELKDKYMIVLDELNDMKEQSQ